MVLREVHRVPNSTGDGSYTLLAVATVSCSWEHSRGAEIVSVLTAQEMVIMICGGCRCERCGAYSRVRIMIDVHPCSVRV
jgi:hypothetical protein